MSEELTNLLNKEIPNDKVLNDLWKILNEGDLRVELNEKWVDIPSETPVDIVTKAYFLETYDNIGFGVYRVLLAIGGFRENPHGFHTAGICFSTLYYDKNRELITLDFHEKFR